jgi:Flp pilus assembly protein TadD
MKTVVTEIELKKMIDKFKDNPKDLDLINQIAIGYFENPSMQTDDDEKKFFELAYSIKKTIKTTHNLAWYLYFEWGEQERAIRIQKELINKNPKSFYPFYLLGFMLMEKMDYKNATKFLLMAAEKSDRRDILHNLGCCYFKLGNVQIARDYFAKATTDHDFDNRSTYNLAILDFKNGNIKSARKIADNLLSSIEVNVHQMISGYEIGFLYFLLEDFKMASDCLVKQGIDGLDLIDWKELSYSLFVTDKNNWNSQHNKMIAERENLIVEINTQPEDLGFDSEKEKNERLAELKCEIENIKELIKNGITKPDLDLSENVWIEPCGCLLFDCKRHENQPDDE